MIEILRDARKLRAWLPPTLAGLFFALLSLAILPYAGLQNDELFFSGPLYSPDETWFSVPAWGMKIPFMVTSYSGALKTWLYAGQIGRASCRERV